MDLDALPALVGPHDLLCTDPCLGFSESDPWCDREACEVNDSIVDDFILRSEQDEDPQSIGCRHDVPLPVSVDGMQRYENDGSIGPATALAEVSRPHTQSPPSVHVRARTQADPLVFV